jgi:molybdopterin converting factor small subunit
MKIISFGQIVEITGNENLIIDNVSTTNQLRKTLSELYPALNHITYLIAVNQSVVKEDLPLQNSDEIALLPPFSGG